MREDRDRVSPDEADTDARGAKGREEETSRSIPREREVASTPRGRRPADVPETVEAMPLLPAGVVEELRARWSDIQAAFVDNPRESVQAADALVAEAMREISESFSAAREDMEREWDRGEDISTEDLRVALQRYREFFGRLLEV